MSGESIKVAVRFRANEGDDLKANWRFESETVIFIIPSFYRVQQE